MKLETTYLGLSLAHPIVAGASPLTATFDGVRRLEDAGAAAIVTASLYEKEILDEEEALEWGRTVGAESHPEVTTYQPPLQGCRTPLEGHLETVRRSAESLSVPLIASLHATTREAWVGMAADVESAGAAAIELNLFAVPTATDESSADVEEKLVGIVREVRGAVRIPLAVKLGPCFTALPHLAAAVADAGAGGLVLFNRFYETDIDLATMTVRPTLELSTRRDIRFPLWWTALLAGKTPLSLASTGGVERAEEVVKYLLAGADIVQTASALMRNAPEYMGRLVDGLSEWLDAHGATSVSEIRGRMSAAQLQNPEVLSRAQPTPTMLLECPCE